MLNFESCAAICWGVNEQVFSCILVGYTVKHSTLCTCIVETWICFCGSEGAVFSAVTLQKMQRSCLSSYNSLKTFYLGRNWPVHQCTLHCA